MPKKNKKGKQEQAAALVAQTDDAFDDMLAELRAADIANRATSSSSSSTHSTAACASSVCTPASSSTQKAPEDPAANVVREASVADVPEEAIMDAVKHGDLATLWRWARRGLCIPCSMSSEVLRSAIVSGNLDVMRCLIMDLGADINQENVHDFSQLMTAVLKGNLVVMRCLVEEFGADVNAKAGNGLTPLVFAAIHSNTKVLRFMVNELGADVDKEDKARITPVTMAVQRGGVDMLRFLGQELGANVNKSQSMATHVINGANVSVHGYTLLFIAANKGSLDYVGCLVEDLGVRKCFASGGQQLYPSDDGFSR
jgi:hypothetical protein